MHVRLGHEATRGEVFIIECIIGVVGRADLELMSGDLFTWVRRSGRGGCAERGQEPALSAKREAQRALASPLQSALDIRPRSDLLREVLYANTA